MPSEGIEPNESSPGQPTPESGAAHETAPPQDLVLKVEPDPVGFYRRAAEKAQKELEALRRSQMTDQERVKAERDEFERRALEADRRVKEILLQARFESAAAKAHCHDPKAAFALADRSLLDVSEDGKALGIDKAVAALKQSKPYLFGPPRSPSIGSGGGNPGTPPPESTNSRMNGWIRKLAGYN